VGNADKCFKTFFYVRQNDEFVDDWVGRFSSDNAGFGQAYITPCFDSLFRVPDSGTFHWAFHRSGAATCADVYAP